MPNAVCRVNHNLFKGERLFHSTPKLIHISSRFDNDDPLAQLHGRRKSRSVIDRRHVCIDLRKPAVGIEMISVLYFVHTFSSLSVVLTFILFLVSVRVFVMIV